MFDSQRQLILTLSTLIYASYGSFIGWPAPTLLILESEDSPVPLTADEGSWLASINSLTMLVGIFAAGFAVDRVGRKKLLLAAAVPLLVWWLMVAFAESFGMLLAARSIGSLSGGLINTVMPMYLSEIADADIRGTIITVHNVLTDTGSLLIYCLGPYLSITNAAAICAILPVIFFITFVWMPESPYFLLMRRREQDAVKTLQKIKGNLSPEELKVELEMMHDCIRRKQETKGKLKDLLTIPVHRRTLLVTLGFIILQMSTGAIALSTYTNTIYKMSGSELDPNLSSIMQISVQLLSSVGASLVIDRFGRKTLVMVSLVTCGICLAVEGAYFYVNDVQGDVPSAFAWVPLAAMIGFNVSFSFGAGSVLYPIIGEIYHVSVKGAATSINTTVIALYGFFLKKMFQVVSDSVGAYWSFWAFSVLCVCGAVYTFFLLPETKGKTFAQINQEMDARFGGSSRKLPEGLRNEEPEGDVEILNLPENIPKCR
ncbi:facilitated trehalose transporter Tret1-like [Schistocerca gregaria]|uniref:facilitated trehalose transporter Tret1-like n=1 Tax=Schistocerca gregaria TaxID=7010 RepID=UPI00211EAC38|nr:facilitated trehalose transporter Tret1-like [Schistocerca gregaria]